MARENSAPGWFFSAALVNHDDCFFEIGFHTAARSDRAAPIMAMARASPALARGSAISMAALKSLSSNMATASSNVGAAKAGHASHQQQQKAHDKFHAVIRCISSATTRAASSGEAHMASPGRIKSGFCGSNMSRSLSLHGIEGHAGDFKQVGPPADDGLFRCVGILRKGDVVRAVFGCLHGSVAGCCTVDANNAVFADGLAAWATSPSTPRWTPSQPDFASPMQSTARPRACSSLATFSAACGTTMLATSPAAQAALAQARTCAARQAFGCHKEKAGCCHQAFSRAFTPGRGFPSSHSRKAPPAVEM